MSVASVKHYVIRSVIQPQDSLELEVHFIGKTDPTKKIRVRALVDSSAQINDISASFLQRYPLSTTELWRAINVTNADSTPNKNGQVTMKTEQLLRINDHQEEITLHIVNLPDVDMILGYPWLQKHDPTINWTTSHTDFDHCPTACIHFTSQLPLETTEDTDTAICAYASKSQQLAEQAHIEDTRELKDKIPAHYHKYLSVFDEAKSMCLPEHKPYDHAIEIPEDWKPDRPKAYRMSPDEEKELAKFIQENLDKGYIRPSKSHIVSPFFFVKKKDGKLCPVQDYRKLNSVTCPNRYLLPQASSIIDKLHSKNCASFNTTQLAMRHLHLHSPKLCELAPTP